MEIEFVKLWEDNKNNLRNFIANTEQSKYADYKELVSAVIDYIINVGVEKYGDIYDTSNITVIDNGDYQGTQIFLVPANTYQPAQYEYLVTYVNYGSCSGCDTLQSINSYEDGLPSKQQVNDYMSLCLHLIQNMKPLY